MSWKTIRLELAQSDGFPHGSASRAYLIRAPLDEHGVIDAAAVELDPTQATVRRFWASEPDQYGYLERVNGGWALRLKGEAKPVARLGSEPLHLHGEVMIANGSGKPQPFRVKSIRSFGATAAAGR